MRDQTKDIFVNKLTEIRDYLKFQGYEKELSPRPILAHILGLNCIRGFCLEFEFYDNRNNLDKLENGEKGRFLADRREGGFYSIPVIVGFGEDKQKEYKIDITRHIIVCSNPVEHKGSEIGVHRKSKGE